MKMFKTFGAFGVLAFADLAAAASTSHYLRVNVPFAFAMAGEQFLPGEYRVTESDNGVVLVQGSGKAAAVLTIPESMSRPGQANSLRFTSTPDGTSYLSGLAVEGEPTRAVPANKQLERKLALSH